MYMYGDGLTCAQHPVDVERVDRLVEVEALGEDDLEDVAGEDVLRGRLDRALVAAGLIERDSGTSVSGVCGRRRRRVRQRAREVGDEGVEPDDGARRTASVEPVSASPVRRTRSRSGRAAGGSGRTR